MLSLFAATLALAPQQAYNAGYRPNGPVIVTTMQNGKSFEITTDRQNSPLTVAHIAKLVRKGFYDKQRIHRVEWWVTQWGAPKSATIPYDKWWAWKYDKKSKTMKPEMTEDVGGGGSGKDIAKFEEASNVDFVRGIVGIASTGLQVPGDSQIFILKADALRLYRSYAVVGKVTKGMEVVDAIKRGDRIKSMKIRK